MTIAKQTRRWAGAALLIATLSAPLAYAQKSPTPTTIADSTAATDAVREQLLTLLRVSPTLTAVVASDPSLLANTDYVAKTNPALAEFLKQHPEIGRNPDFYLFADIHTRGEQRVRALERRVWTGEPEPTHQDSTATRIMQVLAPALVGVALFLGIGWLIRVILANRRWNRVFRLQTEVHGKLIDRFGSSEEILTYMQTDAGKRFLEAAPISVELAQETHWPAALQRVLTPLTVGLVLTLLGVGMLYLRHTNVGREGQLLLTIFGIVALMPGLGCVIAAGITWVLVQRLGLMSNTNRVD